MLRHRYSDQVRIQLDASEGDMTQQEFKAECDINNIMAKYQRTGTIDHIATYAPQYGDVLSQDYQEALNTIIQSQDMFDDLPSKLRAFFHNDPAEFMDFVERDGTDGVYNKLRELGYAAATPEGTGSYTEPPNNPEPGNGDDNGNGDSQ